MRKSVLQNGVLSLALLGTVGGVALGVDHEEGGYAGTDDQGHSTVVYNFLKHFNYNQYYYSASSQWEWNNDARVDEMDFSVFGGHGAPWFIVGQDGVGVDLRSAGSGGDLGYGTWDCEFIAFESCKVVPSPLERSDWYSNWTQSGGIFDGLHMALGFRTNSYQSTDQDVMDRFGWYIDRDFPVWESWFWAIDEEARSIEKGSAVMYPPCDGESYGSPRSDPPRNHTSLRCYYQR